MNQTKGFQLYQQESREWNEWATNDLTSCYLRGTGVGEDKKKAFGLYEQSVDEGNPSTYGNLGVCHENGYGVKENVNKAVEMYRHGVHLELVLGKMKRKAKSCCKWLPIRAGNKQIQSLLVWKRSSNW